MKKEKPASKTSSAKKVKSKAEQEEELRKPAKLQPLKKANKNWKNNLLEDEDDLIDDDLSTDTLDDDLALDSDFDEDDEDRY